MCSSGKEPPPLCFYPWSQSRLFARLPIPGRLLTGRGRGAGMGVSLGGGQYIPRYAGWGVYYLFTAYLSYQLDETKASLAVKQRSKCWTDLWTIVEGELLGIQLYRLIRFRPAASSSRRCYRILGRIPRWKWLCRLWSVGGFPGRRRAKDGGRRASIDDLSKTLASPQKGTSNSSSAATRRVYIPLESFRSSCRSNSTLRPLQCSSKVSQFVNGLAYSVQLYDAPLSTHILIIYSLPLLSLLLQPNFVPI